MNKAATAILSISLLTALVATAVSDPIIGTYSTLAGTILPGRAAESNPCDGCDGQIGNMIHAESWSGSALGTQWRVECPQIGSAPVLLLDTVVGGNGQRIYRTEYLGGKLWLSNTGSWAPLGDPNYNATLNSFTVITTLQIIGGQIAGAVSNINLSGTFDGSRTCFAMAISNAALIGRTPMPAPASYPGFEGPGNCSLVGTSGSWWTVNDVTFNILGSCATPLRPMTWGQVKSIYR
jgi:hypothetical protein